MAIEITGRANSPTPIKTPSKAEVDGEKKVAITTTEKSDSIALTAATQEMKKSLGSATPRVDIDRVNAVKKALADGSYSVNTEKTAKKLIQFEKLMSQENST